MQTENTIPNQAVQGDIVHILDLAKFKKQYRGATAEIMRWHHDNVYTALANGETITITGYEFVTTYRNY